MADTRALRGGRAVAAGQRGYALIGALFVVILFAGVSLTALMNMTISSTKIGDNQRFTSREVRAADNALDAAINQLRMDPDGELGLVDDCPAPTDYPSNSRVVTVTATCTESPQAMPVTDSPTADAPAISLVGPLGYASGSGFADTVDWRNDCLRGTPGAPSCAPWSLGIGSANFNSFAGTELGAAAPSLVHTSALDPTPAPTDPLNRTLFAAADVAARRGSATMIDPSRRQPALKVAGRYEQGDTGLFAAQGSVDCGISTVGHPWNVLAAQIVDADDAAGLPDCGASATAATALDDRAELAPRPGIGEQFATFATTPSCPVGSVLELAPGAYGKAQTAALNDLLGGACPNRTFWFKPAGAGAPGSYWFDVDDPTNPDGSPRPRDEWSSLTISDPTARVIFGTPAGGNSASAAGAATFPNACDPTAAGVEIVLSPRTSIRHLAGKVAVCDPSSSASTSNVPAAIWQAGSADGGWTGVPDASASTSTIEQLASGIFGWTILPFNSGSATVSDPDNAWVTDGAYATAEFTCNIILNGKCAGDATFEARDVRARDTAGTPGPAPAPARLDSLDLMVRAQASGTDRGFTLWSDGQIGTQIDVHRAGSVGTVACSVYFPFIPDGVGAANALTVAFDLLSPTAQQVGSTPRCRDVGLTRADLDGAGVDVSYRLNKDVNFGFGTYTNRIFVDGMELRAGWDLRPTGATGGPGWSNPANLLVTDAQHGGYTLSGCPAFGSCATDTRYADVTGFDNTRSPHVPTGGTLARAGVIVTGETTNQSFFANGSFFDRNGEPDISEDSTLRVVVSNLRDSPSASCTATWDKVPFWGQGLYLDLLDPAVSGTCSSVLTSAEQLIGANARVEVYVERNNWGAFVDYGTRIDSVRISTVTTGGYSRPRAPMLLTVGGGPGSDSSFSVFGQVSMSRNDLNVRWDGPSPVDAEGEAVPIGGGNMVLSGLGSHVSAGGEAGVVCCSPTKPAERIVDLVATVGGRDVGTARVRISDVGGPGSNLFIDDWSLT